MLNYRVIMVRAVINDKIKTLGKWSKKMVIFKFKNLYEIYFDIIFLEGAA
jgi:hypothetical protein